MGIKVKDLALKLNLSPATVSLVLNNKPGISEVTRNKVRSAVIEMGYEELLVNKEEEKKNILFLVYRKNGKASTGASQFSELFSEIIEGVESQTRILKYNLMIYYIDENNYKEEVYKINKDIVEGVLVLATEMDEMQLTIFTQLKIPVVIMDNYLEQEPFDCITINNEQGVCNIIRHFAEMGHRKIGYLHVSENANNFTERYYGYLRAMQMHDMKIEKDFIYDIITNGGEAVYEQLKEKLSKQTHLPTAFFADNDIVALCAMRVFRELGYNIPEDISIVGFDNMAMSELFDPPLTTIQIPKRDIGVTAVNHIVNKINKQTEGVMKVEVQTNLIVRNSVSRK